MAKPPSSIFFFYFENYACIMLT